MYADFRKNFDRGFKTILGAIAKVTSEAQGRIESPTWHIDWAIDWGFREEAFFLRLTMVEQAEDKPYTVLCECELIANEAATARYLAFQKEQLDWVERAAIVEMTAASLREGEHHFVIDDQFPKVYRGALVDSALGAAYKLEVFARRMGEDNGKAVFFDYGEQ